MEKLPIYICWEYKKEATVNNLFWSNKARKVSFDHNTMSETEYSDSDYVSDDGFDEDIVYGVLRDLQKRNNKRQYHMDPNTVSQSRIEEMKMDISSATDCDINHNHNYNQDIVSSVDTEEEYAVEENYCYRAQQK